MQRLHNVDKWFQVEAGKAVNFGASTEPRHVRLDVNSEGVSYLYYADGDGVTRYLARVEGRDVIEFRSTGEFSITVEGSDVWMYTIDGEDLSFKIPDARKLTKLIERRPRDPALELMEYQMRRNMDERMRAIADEMERRLNRHIAAIGATSSEQAPPGAGDGVGGKPESDGQSETGGGDKPADEGTGKSK